MANWNDPQPQQTGFGGSFNPGFAGNLASTDAGLRRYMLSIYNYMASGVLLSGMVALLIAQQVLSGNEAVIGVLRSPLRWLLILAPFGFIMAMNIGFQRMQSATLKALFWAFCAVMGVSMSTLLIVYTGSSVASAFFAAAGGFAGLSLVGYTTRRNLSALGAFCTMGVWGLLIAMLISWFFPMPGMSMAISLIGVAVFAGLTAWDTQRLKETYYQVAGTPYVEKVAVMGALTLYLDFINLFQFLLSFLGDRR
ncbi:MAG: Bax inhibitor-1/YccA family protein [Proteobacteria bacterium]|nr:Bax inhibitor-1/YccA family protein [Pseudomonadota bacterium]